MGGLNVLLKMTTIQNARMSSVITAIAALLVMLATWMSSGASGFEPTREIITLLLLIWLATGSTVARWIVGILTALALPVSVIGSFWLISNGLDLATIFRPHFIIIAFAVTMYAFVTYRLLIWKSHTKQTKM